MKQIMWGISGLVVLGPASHVALTVLFSTPQSAYRVTDILPDKKGGITVGFRNTRFFPEKPDEALCSVIVDDSSPAGWDAVKKQWLSPLPRWVCVVDPQNQASLELKPGQELLKIAV